MASLMNRLPPARVRNTDQEAPFIRIEASPRFLRGEQLSVIPIHSRVTPLTSRQDLGCAPGRFLHLQVCHESETNELLVAAEEQLLDLLAQLHPLHGLRGVQTHPVPLSLPCCSCSTTSLCQKHPDTEQLLLQKQWKWAQHF